MRLLPFCDVMTLVSGPRPIETCRHLVISYPVDKATEKKYSLRSLSRFCLSNRKVNVRLLPFCDVITLVSGARPIETSKYPVISYPVDSILSPIKQPKRRFSLRCPNVGCKCTREIRNKEVMTENFHLFPSPSL